MFNLTELGKVIKTRKDFILFWGNEANRSILASPYFIFRIIPNKKTPKSLTNKLKRKFGDNIPNNEYLKSHYDKVEKSNLNDLIDSIINLKNYEKVKKTDYLKESINKYYRIFKVNNENIYINEDYYKVINYKVVEPRELTIFGIDKTSPLIFSEDDNINNWYAIIMPVVIKEEDNE